MTSAYGTHGGRIEFVCSQREAGRVTMRSLGLEDGIIMAVVTPTMLPEAAGPAAQRVARNETIFTCESNSPFLRTQMLGLYDSLKGTSTLGDADAARIRTVMDGIIKAMPMEQQHMSPAAGRAGR